jgi:hypothetical protein
MAAAGCGTGTVVLDQHQDVNMHVSCVCSRSALCSRPCLCSRSACSSAWTLCDQHAVSLCACRKEWTLLRDDSIFVDWQRLKVQENVEEVSSSCDGCSYAWLCCCCTQADAIARRDGGGTPQLRGEERWQQCWHCCAVVCVACCSGSWQLHADSMARQGAACWSPPPPCAASSIATYHSARCVWPTW